MAAVVGGDVAAEVVQRAREQRHQLVVGVLPDGVGDLGGVDLGQLPARPRARGLRSARGRRVATVK